MNFAAYCADDQERVAPFGSLTRCKRPDYLSRTWTLVRLEYARTAKRCRLTTAEPYHTQSYSPAQSTIWCVDVLRDVWLNTLSRAYPRIYCHEVN